MELKEAFEYGLISRYRLRTGLKSCRICGGEAELFEQQDSTFVIQCCGCGITTRDSSQERLWLEALFRLWNHRSVKKRVMGNNGLLSCPWCGGLAEYAKDRFNQQNVRCSGCGMHTLKIGDITATWNNGARLE